MLILAVTEYFNKLFQYGCLASVAPLGKLRRIMVMTVDVSIMFVITVLCSKHGGTERACEMVHMILSVQGGNV